MRISLEGTLETTVLFICLVFVVKYLGNGNLRKATFLPHSFRMSPVVEGKLWQMEACAFFVCDLEPQPMECYYLYTGQTFL